MSSRVLSLTFILCSLILLFLLAPSSWAQEEVWDNDLKRYLTPQELSHEEIFLTVDQAVALMFPESDDVTREIRDLGPEEKTVIQNRIGWKFPETSFDVFTGKTKGNVDGYAILQNTIGKHKHMTYMVGVTPEGQVFNVELLVYRESRGSEVGRKRFNYQYEGKDLSDPIRINRDVINISGATMSVRSMSAGIKRALVLVDELYLKPLGLQHKAIHAKGPEKGFWNSILGN